MSTPIVIGYPTIMDGPVLRWFRDEAAAKACDEFASASRNRYMIDDDVPDEVADAVAAAHLRLTEDDRADMSDLITHTKRMFSDEITPVAADA